MTALSEAPTTKAESEAYRAFIKARNAWDEFQLNRQRFNEVMDEVETGLSDTLRAARNHFEVVTREATGEL